MDIIIDTMATGPNIMYNKGDAIATIIMSDITFRTQYFSKGTAHRASVKATGNATIIFSSLINVMTNIAGVSDRHILRRRVYHSSAVFFIITYRNVDCNVYKRANKSAPSLG